MRHLLKRNSEFWTNERSLTALMIYLMVAVFFWMPLADYHWWGFVFSNLIFNLILLSGVFAVLTRWTKQLFFISLALMASLVRIVAFFYDYESIQLASYAITILFLFLLIRTVLLHIFKEGPVNFYRIQGSIAVYLLIGITWAFLYDLLEHIAQNSFALTGSIQASADTFSQFLYFSFITMTTLGYGDMVPVSAMAKSLVIFQGMTGMLYPVIMIARLVSLEVDHSRSIRK
jgi:Ion channel